jgi:hypothetical protein
MNKRTRINKILASIKLTGTIQNKKGKFIMSDLIIVKEMKTVLRKMAMKEATKLFRLARKARAHGCSNELVYAIQGEAWNCETNLFTYPDRMLAPDFENTMLYAFKY